MPVMKQVGFVQSIKFLTQKLCNQCNYKMKEIFYTRRWACGIKLQQQFHQVKAWNGTKKGSMSLTRDTITI
jgi:hypothetical protein